MDNCNLERSDSYLGRSLEDNCNLERSDTYLKRSLVSHATLKTWKRRVSGQAKKRSLLAETKLNRRNLISHRGRSSARSGGMPHHTRGCLGDGAPSCTALQTRPPPG